MKCGCTCGYFAPGIFYKILVLVIMYLAHQIHSNVPSYLVVSATWPMYPIIINVMQRISMFIVTGWFKLCRQCSWKKEQQRFLLWAVFGNVFWLVWEIMVLSFTQNLKSEVLITVLWRWSWGLEKLIPYVRGKSLIQWTQQPIPSALRRFRVLPRKSGETQ